MKRTAITFVGLLLGTLLVGLPAAESAQAASGTPKAVNGKKVTLRLRAAIKQLPVRNEVRAGYARTKFKHWDDADHDCRDARAEVLAQESKVRTRGKCTITSGRWFSYYDHQSFTVASQLDIDHLVPLAEAWDSGARKWGASKREAYANDLGDKRSLIAVSASSNRSKGDQDPAEWMPTYGNCRYVKQWVATKVRWSLSIDRVEKRALKQIARGCRNTRITTHKAAVKFVSGGGSTSGGGGTTTGGGDGGLDPRFGTCTEAKSHGYGPYYAGSDPEYSWYDDRDHDGIVCE